MRPTPVWPSLLGLALWQECDRRCLIWLHQCGRSPLVAWPLVVVSRLGNGLAWYVIMALLPWLDPAGGTRHALQLALLGGLNLAIYAWVKPRIARTRPCHSCPEVQARTPPLDAFSFPSGHTLHAVAFTLVLSHHYPLLSIILWSFCALVALSRVVLGLHYPSDVLCAIGLALLTGYAALMVLG